MDKVMKEIGAMIGTNQEIVDILDGVLTGPDDRAYLICSSEECRNSVTGRCTIHTVKSRREILSNGRCSDYLV